MEISFEVPQAGACAHWQPVPSTLAAQPEIDLEAESEHGIQLRYHVWCAKLGSRGISLENISYRNIPLHHTKQGCFGRLAVRATYMLHANFFQKTLHFLRNRHFYLFWGGFV
jgi:hypothetical protein